METSLEISDLQSSKSDAQIVWQSQHSSHDKDPLDLEVETVSKTPPLTESQKYVQKVLLEILDPFVLASKQSGMPVSELIEELGGLHLTERDFKRIPPRRLQTLLRGVVMIKIGGDYLKVSFRKHNRWRQDGLRVIDKEGKKRIIPPHERSLELLEVGGKRQKVPKSLIRESVIRYPDGHKSFCKSCLRQRQIRDLEGRLEISIRPVDEDNESNERARRRKLANKKQIDRWEKRISNAREPYKIDPPVTLTGDEEVQVKQLINRLLVDNVDSLVRVNPSAVYSRLEKMKKQRRFQFITVICPGKEIGSNNWKTTVSKINTRRILWMRRVAELLSEYDFEIEWHVFLGDVHVMAGIEQFLNRSGQYPKVSSETIKEWQSRLGGEFRVMSLAEAIEAVLRNQKSMHIMSFLSELTIGDLGISQEKVDAEITKKMQVMLARARRTNQKVDIHRIMEQARHRFANEMQLRPLASMTFGDGILLPVNEPEIEDLLHPIITIKDGRLLLMGGFPQLNAFPEELLERFQ